MQSVNGPAVRYGVLPNREHQTGRQQGHSRDRAVNPVQAAKAPVAGMREQAGSMVTEKTAYQKQGK